MQILSQRDLRWCNLKLGASSLTVGRFGCTTASMSMLSDYFKGYLSPDKIASNKKNYTKDGLVVWEALKFPTMKFSGRVRTRDDRAIKAILKNPSRAVILNVNSGAHWVAALRPTLFGNSYIVADPWSGDKCDVLKRYKNITGFAYFSKI